MNNFDQSSTGVNIELSVFRDICLSQLYFDDYFFKVGDDLIYSGDNFSDFEKGYTFTKPDLLVAWAEVESKNDFLENFRTKMGFGYSKATKQDLIDYIQGELYYKKDWLEFCNKAGFKPNFDIVASRGYSQGTYSEVIVPHSFWEAVGIEKPSDVQQSLGSAIDNLLWNAPIHCNLEVNGKEYQIGYELKDSYEWDKEEVLKIVKRLIAPDFSESEQKIIMDYLVVNLPEYPDCQ